MIDHTNLCERHFVFHVKRNDEGNFIVLIPLKNNLGELGNSRELALKRSYSQEQRLVRNPTLYSEYRSVFNEYVQLGHMTEIKNESIIKEELNYYMPPHAVVKKFNNYSRKNIRCVNENRFGIE